MIETFSIVILSILIGYLFGRFNKPEEVLIKGETLTLKKMRELYKSVSKDTIPTGVIKPKTAQDLLLKNAPKEKREGLEEMKRTLDATPEISSARDLLVKQANATRSTTTSSNI